MRDLKSGKSYIEAGVLFAVLLLATAPLALAQSSDDAAAVVEPSIFVMAIDRLFRLLTGTLIGVAVGMFCSPAFAQLRYFLFVRLRRYLIAAGVLGFTLFEIYGDPGTADSLSYLGGFILGLAAFNIGIRLGYQPSNEEVPRPTSFGSAKWANLAHLIKHDLIGTDGFTLGEFRAQAENYPLQYTGARHLLTVAPTRSGKGVSSIIPNLLAYEGSAVVIDPKGENALITAWRRGAGSPEHGITGLQQKVFLLDPWDIAASQLGMKAACFNPLDWIKAGDPDATENAFIIADALVIQQGGGENSFWDEEAKALLTGVILYVATAPEEAKSRHLGRVRDIITQDDVTLKATLVRMLEHPNAVVSSTAARTVSKDTKLRSSVFASAQAHTHFLESPRIRKSLSTSSFKFEELKTKKLTVYLILPADRLSTFNRWLRLLTQQAITVNARNIAEKPAKPILFMLDELPSLGRLQSVEQAYGLMAGFGMQLWGIVQDLSQLAHIYGETSWQTFISNSGVVQYFGSRDKMTAEYFSSLCGVTTIETKNESFSIGRALGFTNSSSSGSNSSTSSSDTQSWTRTTGKNEAQRQLAYPDELMILKADQQLVFVENLDPIAAQKVRWFDEPRLRLEGFSLHGPLPALAPPPPPAQPPVLLSEWDQARKDIAAALGEHPTFMWITQRGKRGR